MSQRSLLIVLVLTLLMLPHLPAGAETSTLTDAQRAERVEQLFGRDNLVAWCVVPFDAKRRAPEPRTQMLRGLGFKHLAYDWRNEDIEHFDKELEMLAKYDVELTSFWFPGGLNEHSRIILDLLERHNIQTQLWILIGEPPVEGQEAKIRAAAEQIRPIAEAAKEIGCTVALYNHMGWFGEPENQIAIIELLDMDNVGIVYNQHHGHHHLDRFPELLEKMMPYLMCLNLNGMSPEGDQHGQKIWPLGYGDLDVELLNIIVESDYEGPIGIIGHTMDDVELRLLDNLMGLEWIKPQLRGETVGERPALRTQ